MPNTNDLPDGRADALAGLRVGITAERRREELGTALERHGAEVVYGPAIRIVPLADDTRLRAATERCVEAPLDLMIATTGVGFRGWVEAGGSFGLAERLMARFAAATILTRGPKVRGAVRAAGLREAWSPDSESSAEVLEHVRAHHDLQGCRVAVQLHGDPLRDLVESMRSRGAEVIEVPVYRWEPPADEQPLRDLIAEVVDRRIDAVTFTSAPAATNFLQTSAAMGLREGVLAAVSGPARCFAVGPVTAGPLLAEGLEVVQPDRFRLGALVRLVTEILPGYPAVADPADHRGRRLPASGSR